MKYLGNLNNRDIYCLAYAEAVWPDYVIFSGYKDEGATIEWQTVDLEFNNAYQIYYDPKKK